MGRTWESPTGNFYASTIVRVAKEDPPAEGLAFVAAVAVHAALSQTAPAIDFRLKWPNDILTDDAKLCGMLLERQEDAVIAGIGINLAQHPEGLDRPVTSLAGLGMAPPEPQIFLEMLAPIFGEWLARWRIGGLAGIMPQWRQYAHRLGDPLRAALPDGETVDGRYETVSDDGTLKLRLADGSFRAIHAGDIFLR